MNDWGREVGSGGKVEASVMVVGDHPGREEIGSGQPFSGQGGRLLDEMLREAGIGRGECYLTYAVKVMPKRGVEEWFARSKKAVTGDHTEIQGKMVLEPVMRGLEKLEKEVRLVKPKVILAVGNVAMWALTGKWGIGAWRGSLLEDRWTGARVVPTYAPESVMKQMKMKGIVVHDMRRGKFELENRTPEPKWEFQIGTSFEQTMGTLDWLWQKAEFDGPLTLGVDIETAQCHITSIGVAWSETEMLWIPFLLERMNVYWGEVEEKEVVWGLYKLFTHRNVICTGHNFGYDCQYLLRRWGWMPKKVVDTMLWSHTLSNWEKKSLAYVASKHCSHYEFWKNIRGDKEEAEGESDDVE